MRTKNFTNFLSLLGIVLLTVCSFSACSDDDNETKTYSLAFNVNFSGGNRYDFTNDQTMQVTLALDTEKSSAGVEIENVEYYIDDTYAGSSSMSPFTMRYPCTGLSIGTHVLRVNVTWTVDGYHFTSQKDCQFYVVAAGQSGTTADAKVTFSVAE